MKKIFSIFLTFSLIVMSFSGFASAKEKIDSEKNTTIVNEYLLLKDLKKKTDLELQELGYTEDDILQIRDIDYSKELKKRSKLDEKLLKHMGYDEDQVKKLKNFKGTEDEIVSLASTLTFSVPLNEFSYNRSLDRSYWRVLFSWSWSSNPFVLGRDTIAAVWDPGGTLETGSTNSYHVVNYVRNTNGYNSSKTFNFLNGIDAPGRSAYNDFKMAYPYPATGPSDYYDIARSGSGWVKMSRGGWVRDATMAIQYGHQTTSISGASVSFPAGLSISFANGIERVGAGTQTLTNGPKPY